ncbi:MAG: TetR/AcrR family transcriptional regulator [Gemmatimonadaceae bacterium]
MAKSKQSVSSTESTATPSRGRPRSATARQAILDATLEAVFIVGFRALSMDAIAAAAGVGKMTIYRRWPNKAALVMDAFLSKVGPTTAFPETPTALASIHLQMRLQVKAFRGRYGRLIKSLLGEAQFDAELASAFREQWIMPRRVLAREAIERAIREKDFRADVDVDVAIDMLYAPIYYRLQIGVAPLSEQYVDDVFEQVVQGLQVERRKRV